MSEKSRMKTIAAVILDSAVATTLQSLLPLIMSKFI